MTDDQLTAALDQLAAQREQITRLDAREATHYATVTGLLAGLTARSRPGPDPDDPGYQPDPAPCWWQLSPEGRQEPVARLRAWYSAWTDSSAVSRLGWRYRTDHRLEAMSRAYRHRSWASQQGARAAARCP